MNLNYYLLYYFPVSFKDECITARFIYFYYRLPLYFIEYLLQLKFLILSVF